MEMIVVVVIFLIIMGVIMANLPQLRGRTEFDLTMQEILTLIRQIQVYGTAGRKVIDPTVRPTHGLYFNLLDNKKIIVFADENNNHAYDAVEKTDEFALPGDIIVNEICFWKNIYEDCDNVVSITFTNPHVNPFTNFSGSDAYVDKVVITLSSSKLGINRSIVVNMSGLMNIE